MDMKYLKQQFIAPLSCFLVLSPRLFVLWKEFIYLFSGFLWTQHGLYRKECGHSWTQMTCVFFALLSLQRKALRCFRVSAKVSWRDVDLHCHGLIKHKGRWVDPLLEISFSLVNLVLHWSVSCWFLFFSPFSVFHVFPFIWWSRTVYREVAFCFWVVSLGRVERRSRSGEQCSFCVYCLGAVSLTGKRVRQFSAQLIVHFPYEKMSS